MILCVNLNAAIDKTLVVAGFALNRIHRPQRVVQLPGGKGINVARALQTLDENALVTGWVGGFAGRFISAGLAAEGLPAEFCWCDFESRTCLSILDPDHATLTELYEKGEAVPATQVEEFTALFARVVVDADFVTLSGSLPSGVPPDFYAALAQIASAAGVPAALDCGGEALRFGLERGHPALIKPNQAELEGLLGHALPTLEAARQAALETAAQYQTLVVLSLGAQGAVAARGGEAWLARPPHIEPASAVGSGDCMLAALVQGLAHAMDLPMALRRGVAAGTANALTVGAGRFSREDFERILSQTEVIKQEVA